MQWMFSCRLLSGEGFSVHDFDGYAVDAQLGEGDDYIGVLADLDVVEAGETLSLARRSLSNAGDRRYAVRPGSQ